MKPAYRDVVAQNNLAGATKIDGDQSVRQNQSYAARIARTDSDSGSGQSVRPNQSYAARIARTDSDFSAGSQSSGVTHTTQPASGSPGLGGPPSYQPNSVSQTLLYIEAPTNPLPSGYGFIAAPTTASLQHGHANPLPKETLHHG